jgi:cation-transporting ATPase E
MVLLTGEGPTLQRANELAATGQRVLVLAHSDARLEGETLPPELRAAALVLLAERVRDDAAATLAYFARQGVATKLISGDNPLTVAAVALSVGMAVVGQPVDARDLPDDEEALGKILEESSIFGRVTPRQKQAMVLALKANGHTVAMTGDGVNDALALKLADIGVAMGSGSPATKAVAQIVLLDGSFATMPEVVAAGRKVTANIERVANIFIAKTVWATILALIVSVLLWPYPFLPRHLTIIDSLTIGIPSFFLALAPNLRRYTPGFVNRVLRFAIPTGFVVAASVFATFALARTKHLSLVEQRTAATLVALVLSLTVLALVALPLTWRRALLIGAAAAGFALLFPIDTIRRFFALRLPTDIVVPTFVIGFIAMALLIVVHKISKHHDAHADVSETPGNG